MTLREQLKMKSSHLIVLSAVMLALWLLANTVFRSNMHSSVRFFADEYDRSIYFERGMWLVNQQTPYRDVISEYPQIPTYLFGLLHVVTIGVNDLNAAYWAYTAFFSFLMLALLIATIVLLHDMLPQRKYLAYLLLLPAPLYFSLNRFDILPAFLVLLSFKMLGERRWNIAALLLAVGTLTKWYPVLLLPAYLIYRYKVTGRLPWQMVAVFSVTCFIIVVPTLLSGGLDALLVPYRFHMERSIETVSLPTLLSKLSSEQLGFQLSAEYLVPGFLLLQICAVPFVLGANIDQLNKLLYWCVLIITTYIIFSRIYSPQWLLWLFPFYILASKNWVDDVIIVLYGVLTYLGFPVVWDSFGAGSTEMLVMGVVNISLLALIAIRTLFRIRVPCSTDSSIGPSA